MKKILHLLAAICALGAAMPGSANVLIEPSFAAKMARADLVVIGMVTAAPPGGATLDVLHTLKGRAGAVITVSTYSRARELDPQCCEVGATYLMFLHRRAQDRMPRSVLGRYGMIRVGGR
ncbi:MAG TPA: hypothetical protein VEW71_02445 [Allosphingosinicella sp.]|nr:hypothetical protein [Allosphingosinicella sp.]